MAGVSQDCRLHLAGVVQDCRLHLTGLTQYCRLNLAGVSHDCTLHLAGVSQDCTLHLAGVSQDCRLHLAGATQDCRLHLAGVAQNCRLHLAGVAQDCRKRSLTLTRIVRIAHDSHDDLKTAPPLYNLPDPANVKVLLYVTSIDAVNEASMDFTVGILLHLRWVDPRIFGQQAQLLFENDKVESLDFDSENINKVWVPDIFFPNEKKGSFHDIMTNNKMMRLYKDGTILYISRLSMTLSCPMDLMNYPFDKQTCYLLIMSFGYSNADIVLEWMNTTEPFSDVLDGKPIAVDESIVLPQFEVKDVKASTCNKRYHQKFGNHSCLQAEFHMSRNIWFYMVQMYVPSILIVMLSWISFWLTVNSVPGRISLGLLTVLTMTTQSSGVNAALPRVSYTKAIDVWMSTCLVFVFAALLEFAIVNVLSRKDSIRGFSFKHIFSVSKDYDGGETPATEMTLPLDGYPGEVQKKRRFTQKGIVYATYLDIVSRIFFPVCFGIFMLTYWLYYVYRE